MKNTLWIGVIIVSTLAALFILILNLGITKTTNENTGVTTTEFSFKDVIR